MTMENLFIERSKSSPEINFDAESGILKILGESFPENAAKFYAPAVEWIEEFFLRPGPKATIFEIELIYFNSSTSKVLMNMLEMADEAVAEGKDISVRWYCDEENETAIECGEEFKEDLSHILFEIIFRSSV